MKQTTGWLWAVVLVALLALLVARQRGQIERTITSLRRADIEWMLVALAVGLGMAGLLGLTFQPLLRRMGYRVPWRSLVRAHLQRHVVGTITPVGGPASTVAFVRALARDGVGAGDALFAALINSLLGVASLFVFLAPAVVLTMLGGRVTGLVLVGTLMLLAVLAAAAGGMVALLRSTWPAEARGWRAGRGGRWLRDVVVQARSHRLQPRDLLRPLGLHVLVDLCGVVALFACLRAVGWDATVTQALVGYATGTVFLMIAPVFQGLGVVELSMVVTLQGFGLPSGSALAAVLLYRFVEVWLPFALGVSLQAGESREVRRASAHVPAIFAALTGAVAVLSVLAPHDAHRFGRAERYSLTDPAELSRHLTLIVGFFLLFLSYSLWRRKRVAWLAAVALLAIAIPAHLLKHHDQIGALLAAVTLGLLLVHHKRFRVKSDMPTLRLGLARFALSLLFALAYGALGFVLMGERAFGREFSAADALYRTLRLFFSWGDSGLTPHTRYADWFLDSLSLVGVVTGGYAAFSLVRPVVWRRSTLPSERERARVLVEQYGRSSLDFFKYTPDKVYFFASNGQGVVSYGVALATAVALGDPVVATAQEFGGLVDEFVDFCDANGWRVAFHQVPPTNLACYRAAGLSAVKVGEEAIVDLDQFSLSGKAMKHLRATVNRFEREGYRTIWDEPPLSDDTLARLREVSDEWLTFAGRRERGFTLGQFDEDYLRDTPVMSVVGPNGHVVAFANVIPDGVPGEATIDLMRRRATPNGAMDVLYVRLFERMRGAGYRTFSLGMAPFAEVGDAPGASMPERAMHLFYEHFNGFFAYKGLRDYKDKFAPHWEPRYLVYDSDVSLPVVALALIRLTEAV